jgi:hypothetical protein
MQTSKLVVALLCAPALLGAQVLAEENPNAEQTRMAAELSALRKEIVQMKSLYENRIAALAAEIVSRNKGDLLVGEKGDIYGRERLADAMLAMNLDAFRQRYSTRAVVSDLDYIDLDRRNWHPVEAFSEVQFFKSLQCFLYQCCEGNVDEKPLYKTLSAIAALLAPFINQESPEYEAADWG